MSTTTIISPPNALFSRTDTSICPHLAALLESSASDPVQAVSVEASGSIPPPAAAPSSKRVEVESRFEEVVRWGAISEGAKRRKTTSPECHTCSTSLQRPWACLTCPYIGCLPIVSTSSAKDCMRGHWDSSNGECSFAVDPSSGTIFCSQCNDATYPDQFESLFRVVRIRMEESNDKSREPGLVSGGKGRGRGAWKAWNPSNMVKIEERDVGKSLCRGLRPLLNLSQTCFLSAILQSLIHNPLLKAYFLSDKHNRHVCPNGSKGLAVGKPFLGMETVSGAGVGGDRERGCMCCEMDKAFEEFYNDDKSPFGPITMLYAMWHASAELEGYGQQDAHSFFLAALDQIHAHAKGQLSSCNCIAHQTFAGSLLSSVTCSACSTTSTTVDPILDLQLDFPTSISLGNATSTTLSSAGSTSSQEGMGPAQGGQNGQQLTLAGMLRRFCAPERVGDLADIKGYDCSNCGGGAGVVATRQLSIKKLAPVLSFQLKRFAHNSTSSKIETHVRFPSSLDMRPYVDSATATANQTDAVDDVDKLPDSLYTYDLFAVVTHEGKLDNGHYWADVREGEEWWHCDDDKVTPTTLSSVLAQRAYMLFYVKRSLAYAQPMSKLLASTTTSSLNVNASSNTNGHTASASGGGSAA
ncbi:hypothetical protein CI109_105511 [Kwoniella shandongensis]|uniref:Uncharacterized protein n=1 Tax=Kwoniella shandongensis TaxID=1734106 RepID=A0A5M6C805_9TREE|nr:uncharacterized protein CI109_002232 [Kwoniella shandongensis]KAA5529339.1 hypothetical protein CI109_002232 [Kwoniella shandongensis]